MAKERVDRQIEHTCPHCGYNWKGKETPKRCPLCVRWLPPWVTAPDTTTEFTDAIEKRRRLGR